jgi:hypothetical protein
MAAINWTFNGNGKWTTASNWSTDSVPGASDDAEIEIPGVTVTSTGNVTVNSVDIGDGSDLIINTSTTFTAVTGGDLFPSVPNSQPGGAITVKDGGTLALGQQGQQEEFFNDGSVTLTHNAAPTDLLVAGTLILSGNGAIRMDATTGDGGGSFINGGEGTILDNSSFIVGSGVISQLTLNNLGRSGQIDAFDGELDLATNNTINNNGGILGASPGALLVIFDPVDNTTTGNDTGIIVAASNSTIEINLAVTGGTVQFDVGATDATVRLMGLGSLSASTAMIFNGPGQNLVLATGTNQVAANDISGLMAGDSIDFDFVHFAAGDHAVWTPNGNSGFLSLENTSGTKVATLSIVGHYLTADFATTSDSAGGSEIEVVNRQATDDFNGIGTSDILLQNGGGSIIDWIMSNGGYASYNSFGTASGYALVGAEDFNGDGTTDILLENSTGNIIDWTMKNGTFSGWNEVGSPSGYGVIKA